MKSLNLAASKQEQQKLVGIKKQTTKQTVEEARSPVKEKAESKIVGPTYPHLHFYPVNLFPIKLFCKLLYLFVCLSVYGECVSRYKRGGKWTVCMSWLSPYTIGPRDKLQVIRHMLTSWTTSPSLTQLFLNNSLFILFCCQYVFQKLHYWFWPTKVEISL